MIVRQASDFDYAYVCRHLRDLNAEEAFAIRGHLDRVRMAREFNGFAHIAAFRVVFCADDQQPIAVLAAYRAGAGLAAMHLIATDAWPRIAMPAYRFMRRIVVREWFRAHGIVCAQTDVLDRGFADRAWLRALGFVDDGRPAPLGRKGEMFQRVMWRAVDAPAAGLASAGLQQGRSAHV